jgi:nitroreductase
MDVFEAIRRRHSYRGGFERNPVPREHLEQIVQAGIRAPSGCNEQTTSFVIVDEPALVAGIAEVVDAQVVRGAAAVIVCLVDMRPVIRGLSFAAEDCAAAVENMLLAVTALGYATVWLDGMLRVEDRAQRIATLLNVPATLEVRIVLPLGVPTEAGQQKGKKPFAERAWFNRYGA